MPRKEKTNAKTWERDRRNRMNTYFKTLSDLLPPHQEGRKRNKVDILIHASKYIKELNNRTDELFGAHAGEAHKEELNRLKKLVTQLFSRTQLLSALLRDAGITVPAEPALEKISPLKWSNKINVEDSEKYVDRLNERKKSEKRKNKQIGYKVPSKQKNVGLVNETAKKVTDVNETVERGLIEDRENHVNSNINESCEARDTGTGSSNENENSTSGRIVTAVPQHDAVPPLEPTVAKPSKRIRKLESRKKVKRKGKVVDSKMKKKKIHATSAQSQSITNLLPGTLIWSAGKIVPLVTPVTSLTPNILVSAQAQPSNPIILGNAQQNQMIVMQSLTNRVQNSVLPVRNETLMKAVQKVALNGVSSVQTSLGINSRDWSMKNIIEATKIAGRKVILPKGKEITTTTMAYKVPIPAIHREPSTKLNETIDHQNSRKPKKIAKNKKVQKREKAEVEVEVRADKNEATLVDVNNLDAMKPLEASSPTLPESLEINERKRKASEDSTLSYDQQAKIPKIPDLSGSCESIESLRNVIERIGENTNEKSEAMEKSKEDNTSIDVDEPGNSSNESPISKENDETSKPQIAHALTADDATSKDSSRSELENSQDPETSAPPIEPKLVSDWSPKITNKTPKKENEKDSASKSVKSTKDTANDENAEETAFSEVDEAIAKAGVVSDQEKDVCDLGTRFDSLLRATENTDSKIDDNGIVESTKIILNLDTNTTTTMKPEVCLTSVDTMKTTVSPPILSSTGDIVDETRIVDRTKEETLKSLNYSSINTFVPICNNRTDGLHSDLSNDLFASLQVPSSSHNPESISPTAAFLMAFPLVSSLNGKTEVLEEEMKEDLKYHSQTPPMLLQIGAMEPNSFKVKTDPPPAAPTISLDKSNSQESEIVKITHRSTNEAAKSLPKIINNETIKEPLYKVVHYPEAPSVVSDNFVAPPNNTRPSDRINRTIATVEHQSASITENTSIPASSTCTTVTHVPSEACENSIRRCDNQSENDTLVAKYEDTNSERTIVSSNCTSDSSKYGSNGRYPAIPDYVPNYTNFSNSSQQTRSNYGSVKSSTPVNTSESSAISSSLDSTSMAHPSMIRSQAVQSAYVAHTTGKDVVHSMYGNRRKDSIVNPTEAITSYVTFPSVSQTLQHDYLLRNKESYQSYDINGKENNAGFPGYPAVTTKNSTINNTSASLQERSYVIPHITDNVNVKDALNVFQNYPSVPQGTKESPEQDGNNERSRDNQRVEARSTNRKIDNFPVGQSAGYSSFPKDAKNDILAVDTMFQQAKRNEPQSYVPYSRDTKKTVYDGNSSLPQTTKSQTVGNSTIPHYASHQLNPQQEQNCAATSNYPHSTTISDNTIKSTTTVAHNSSNFSILSWTTFSPISGSSINNNTGNSNNANHAQYEATGGGHVERSETKTPCENYTYAPVHKESYGNILPNEGFSADSPIVEKPRDKLVNDGSKPQIFEDSSKPKVVEPIATEQKIARSHNHNRNADYKFAGETKNKSSKYPMGSAYTQTEFSTLEQQQNAKSHQTVNEKSEKSNYPMPTYDPQASFDIPETNVTNKCNNEIYNSSNYKYVEDKNTSLQLKYQSHTHNQSAVLHHDATSYNGVKDVNQQLQQQQQQTISNKSKTLVQQQQLQQEQQQQQPLRPPVNWMMTPEIKHSTNIADLILPPIGKEHEFCQNNIFAQPSSYNQSTPNHQFYNNYDAAVSAPHGFPNIPTLQADPRRIPDGFYPEEQPFSWSPTKSSQIEHNPGQKSMDQNVVPSTLPTLVGDLALGTNISEKQSFLFGQMASRVNKDIVQPPVNKDKEHAVRDYQTMLNAQNPQQTVQGTSFLSVSQLVEQEKAEKSHQQQNHQSHNHNHHNNHDNHTHQHHHHQQQQQSSSHQTSQQQTRKHQRKNTNASPRTTAKRQIETRKTTAMSSVVDPLHSQPTDEQKLSSAHNFSDQSYHHHHHQQQQHHHQLQQHHQTQQTQKFQQNDIHWRNRQCKSNYTAEALIGGNTSVHDNNNSDKQMQASSIKSFASEYPQNKYPTGIGTAEMIMPTINYLSNPSDDPNSYGQTVNQNFNPSSYAYSPNTNIYPTTNFITSIPNTPTNYMMPLHENPSDFIETNSFLLPNVTSSAKTTLNVSSTAISAATSSRLVTSSSLSVGTSSKNQQQHYTSSSVAKNQNCEKRNSYATNGTKKSKRKTDNGSMHNLEFPISTVGPQIDDYHSHPHHPHHHHHHAHPSTFLAPPHANPLYQNHSHTSSVGLTPNANRSVRAATLSNNATLGHHHPSGTSLTNFNLSTIFPEINDKVAGYKPPNVILPELSQTSNHSTVTYSQRGNYTANNILGHVHQESSQFTSDLPAAPPPGVLHYKNT